ncbi:MAG TPA: hypothetical protein VJV78_10450 [Polyangiales bacterium]|nr:hypothetical protein [Polyangiales bacterium]
MKSYLACVFVLLSACGDFDGQLDQPASLTGPAVALDERLLLISGPARRAFLLDAVRKQPPQRAQQVELPFGALSAQRRLGDHDEALVICAGRRDSAQEAAEPAVLTALQSDGRRRNYELGDTPYDSLVQSDDGRYAVLYRSQERQGRVLQNVNELVVVDLALRPGDDGAVTSKTPEGLGHAFTRALVSPEMVIAGESRRLLLLLSAAEITIFDLAHLDRRGTIVELAANGGSAPEPRQVLFGADEPAVYVRGDGADDVFVLRLEPRSADPDLNDFRPTINPLGAGIRPRDMALFGPPDAQMLLVVSRDSQARVIDPRSDTTLPLALPFVAEHVRLFDSTAPGDSEPRTRALLYADQGQTVAFMELTNLASRRERKLETLQLPAEVKSLIEIDRADTLVIAHERSVTMLDLAQRTATPVAADQPLTSALFDAEHERLWVATRSQPRVGTLDLASGKTRELLLDAEVRDLVPFFAGGRLLVVHPSTLGYVTFVDTEAADRKHASSLRGFLLSDILDRGE